MNHLGLKIWVIQKGFQRVMKESQCKKRPNIMKLTKLTFNFYADFDH